MKEEALAIIAPIADPSQKLNVLREYLQALTLRSLHESEALGNMAFVGGTALRFVYALPRFSEDLDFSLHRGTGYRPEAWIKKIKNDLTLGGFDTRLIWNGRSTVHKCWVKVPRILKEAGLAAMADQNLSIKLEIDTAPPAGANIGKTLITRHRLLALQHYDLPSLLAGKLHALLSRRYPKGRDWYDLAWYRGQRPRVEPNLVLLQNALNQTQGAGTLTASEWKVLVKKRLATLDGKRLVDDVAPFLERPEETRLLTPQYLLSTLND